MAKKKDYDNWLIFGGIAAVVGGYLIFKKKDTASVAGMGGFFNLIAPKYVVVGIEKYPDLTAKFGLANGVKPDIAKNGPTIIHLNNWLGKQTYKLKVNGKTLNFNQSDSPTFTAAINHFLATDKSIVGPFPPGAQKGVRAWFSRNTNDTFCRLNDKKCGLISV